MSAYFITATGTGIGKTFITAAVTRQLIAQGRKVRALKPVISGFVAGEENDSTILIRAQGGRDIEAVSPWRFAAPLAPDTAAKREGRSLDFAALVEFCREAIAGEEITLIEGVGGVMVPLDARHTVLDWIAALNIPAVLVTGSYLGTISHTLTSFAVLQARRIPVRRIIMNGSEESPMPLAETAETIARFCGMQPVVIPRLADPDADAWQQVPPDII